MKKKKRSKAKQKSAEKMVDQLMEKNPDITPEGNLITST